MRRILFSLMVIAGVVALLSGGTLAWFSDSADSQSNSFKAGVLSIDNGLVAQDAAIVIPNMAPGDVTDEFVVTIKNNGNIPLGWLGNWQFAGGVSGSVDLKDALYIDYAKMEFLSPNGNCWLDDSTPGYTGCADVFITDGRGSGPYPAWYNTLADLSPFHVVTLNKFNDNAGMVPASVYEHAGALKPGYQYKLTVKFGFAKGAGNEFQGLGPVTAKLTVNATQINAEALQMQGVPAASAPGLKTWMDAQIADQTES